jgi:hypothetical protein
VNHRVAEYGAPSNLYVGHILRFENQKVEKDGDEDDEDYRPICYRCGAKNPHLNRPEQRYPDDGRGGDRCAACFHPFMRCFVTFDVLPLIEVEPIILDLDASTSNMPPFCFEENLLRALAMTSDETQQQSATATAAAGASSAERQDVNSRASYLHLHNRRSTNILNDDEEKLVFDQSLSRALDRQREFELTYQPVQMSLDDLGRLKPGTIHGFYQTSTSSIDNNSNSNTVLLSSTTDTIKLYKNVLAGVVDIVANPHTQSFFHRLDFKEAAACLEVYSGCKDAGETGPEAAEALCPITRLSVNLTRRICKL